MKYTLVLCALLTLSACGFTQINPNKLPDACLGQFYRQHINLDREPLDLTYVISDENFVIKPTLTIHGFDVRGNPNTFGNFGKLTLSGTPTTLDPIEIQMTFYFAKDMLSFLFDEEVQYKTYVIKVKQCGG